MGPEDAGGGSAASVNMELVSGDEGESQKAGAEQHEAGCGQGQEAVGDRIMMTHVTSSFSQCSSKFIKTFRTGLTEAGDAGARGAEALDAEELAARAQARDSTPSNAWAMKIPAPTSPITAVTISNIANILCAPHQPNDAQARTVKRISSKPHTMEGKCGFGATGVPNPGKSGLQEWRESND